MPPLSVVPSANHQVPAGDCAPSDSRDALADRARSGTVPSKIWRLLGDDPADPGVDVGGDAFLAQDFVLHRDRDARAAGHDHGLQVVGLLHPGVGEEGDVDDGVVAEGVEQREVVLGPRHRVPEAKYHSGPAARVHGSTAKSPSCSSSCDTAAGPPVASTTTPGSGVARMSATLTRVSSPGARRRCRDLGAPSPPGITVMVASTVDGATLATMTVSSARPSGVDVPSAQYHALDATSGDGTLTPVRASGDAAATPVDSLEDALCCTTTAATTAARTTRRIGPRRTLRVRRGVGVDAGSLTPAPTRTRRRRGGRRPAPVDAPGVRAGYARRSPARPGRAAHGCDASATRRASTCTSAPASSAQRCHCAS